jgi:hypothetical protein
MGVTQKDLNPAEMTIGAINNAHTYRGVANSAIAKYDVVYIADMQNRARVKFAKADATNALKCSNTLYVAEHAAPTGEIIRVSDWCLLSDVVTTGSAIGKPVYLSEGSPGGWTLTPTKSGIIIGEVLTVHATLGQILLRPNARRADYFAPAALNGGLTQMLWLPVVVPLGNSPVDTVLPNGNTSYEVVEASTQCRAADAGATMQVQTAAGAANVTSTMACAVLNTVTRAASIDSANSTFAAGSTIRVASAGGSVAARGLVMIGLIPR